MTNTKPTSGRLFARLIRLGRQDDAAFLLQHVIARNAVANDNLPPSDGMGVDSIIEVRPTPDEMVRAGKDGLRFNDKGKLVAWRPTDEDGKPVVAKGGKELWLKPVERYKQPRGGKSNLTSAKADEAAHVAKVLSMRGSEAFPPAWVTDTWYPSVGVVYERIKAAYYKIITMGTQSQSRQFLDFHMVDGNRTLEQAAAANPQATVTRGKTAIARGAEFLAGKSDSGGTATEGSFVGAPDAAEMTMIAAMDANVSMSKMGEELEMALSGMTFREIAGAKGHNDNKGGEEWAARAVDRQIAELKKRAA